MTDINIAKIIEELQERRQILEAIQKHILEIDTMRDKDIKDYIYQAIVHISGAIGMTDIKLVDWQRLQNVESEYTMLKKTEDTPKERIITNLSTLSDLSLDQLLEEKENPPDTLNIRPTYWLKMLVLLDLSDIIEEKNLRKHRTKDIE